jgi:hypothetical protein
MSMTLGDDEWSKPYDPKEEEMRILKRRAKELEDRMRSLEAAVLKITLKINYG